MPLLVRLIVALISLLLLACSNPDTSTEGSLTVEDGFGRPISLDAPPERLVSLAPSATELLYAAGASDKMVAVTTADDYPPAVDTLPRFSALPIDFEALVSHEPDLVFASDQVNAARDAETLGNLNIPVYFIAASTFRDVPDTIEKVGAVLGTGNEASSVADSLRAEEDSLAEISNQITEWPRVLFLVGDETLYAFGADTHIHHLIELAGGESITREISNPAPTLSEEFVIDEAPDVIIGAFGDEYDPARLLELHPSWDNVPAIREDRVYSLDADIVVRPGPRLLQGARKMGTFLHPEIY